MYIVVQTEFHNQSFQTFLCSSEICSSVQVFSVNNDFFFNTFPCKRSTHKYGLGVKWSLVSSPVTFHSFLYPFSLPSALSLLTLVFQGQRKRP